jgi:hypothetical protein
MHNISANAFLSNQDLRPRVCRSDHYVVFLVQYLRGDAARPSSSLGRDGCFSE